MSTIREWQKQIHALAKSKGWWTDYVGNARNVGPSVIEHATRALLMIHSEVSEATEELRTAVLRGRVREDGKPEGFPSELADVVIRALDLAEALEIDLEAEIERKHAYNATRAHRHGGKAL